MGTNGLPKQALQYKPKGRRNIEWTRKRWRDQLHLEDQGTGNTPNPSGTWWWWWWFLRQLTSASNKTLIVHLLVYHLQHCVIREHATYKVAHNLPSPFAPSTVQWGYHTVTSHLHSFLCVSQTQYNVTRALTFRTIYKSKEKSLRNLARKPSRKRRV